jgi:hypothetical protein
MQRDALDFIYESGAIPKINPIIGEGFSYHQLVNLHKKIDQLMRILLRRENNPRLPEGFDYVGMELIPVEEEYRVQADGKVRRQPSDKSAGYQHSITDTYLVKYNFVNGGEEFPKYIEIPFVRRGGVMHIRNVKYSIMPVIKTKGLSVTPKGYFVEFPSNRVNFERTPRSFLVNGNTEHVYIPVTTELHRGKKDGNAKFKPPLIGWLFARYGITNTFAQFLNIDVQVYHDNDPKLQTLDTNEFAVCRAPLPYKKETRSQFAVVLPKEQLTPTAMIFIGTMFYVASFFGNRLVKEYLDDPSLWMIMLGYSIFGSGKHGDQHIIAEIDTHLGNVEQMIDDVFRQELLMEGIECGDIYEFLFYIADQTTRMDESRTANLANLWGRYLTCSEYVTAQIRYGIQKAAWDLIRAGMDGNKRAVGLPVSRQKVSSIIHRNIHTDTIQRIVTNHGEVTPFLVTTDNMLVGITSRAIDQTDARKASGSGKKVVDLNDPTKHIHASFLEVGSVANLPKSSPFGWAILNPYLKINELGRIVRKEENVDDLDRVHADLRQKGC